MAGREDADLERLGSCCVPPAGHEGRIVLGTGEGDVLPEVDARVVGVGGDQININVLVRHAGGIPRDVERLERVDGVTHLGSNIQPICAIWKKVSRARIIRTHDALDARLSRISLVCFLWTTWRWEMPIFFDDSCYKEFKLTSREKNVSARVCGLEEKERRDGRVSEEQVVVRGGKRTKGVVERGNHLLSISASIT